jgi:MFS family permease
MAIIRMTSAAAEAAGAAPGPEPRQRAPAAAWYVLAVLVIATVLGAVDKIMLSLLAEPLRKALELSDTQLGLLQGAGFTLFAGLATFPIGWLSDRFDRRYVLAGCVLFWSAATALRGLSPTFSVMFLASIGLGVGEGGLTPITYSLIPELFPRAQRALANMLYTLSAIFGGALGTMLGGALMLLLEQLRPGLPGWLQALQPWRLAFVALAFFGPPVALLLVVGRRLPNAEFAARRRVAEPASAGMIGSLTFGGYFRTYWRTLSGLVVGAGLASVGMSAIATWTPIIAAREFGATPAQLGQGIGLAFLGGTLVGAILGTWMIRVMRRRIGDAAGIRLIALANVAAALLSILLLFVHSAAEIYLLTGLLIVPLIGGAIVTPNVMQDVCPSHLRARVISVLMMVSLAFGVLSPVLVGVVSDAARGMHDGLAYALVSITLVCAGSGALLLRINESAGARLIRSMQPAP